MADLTVNATGTIANDAVTNAKLANMAEATVKGRAVGAGTGDPTDLTADQASTILDAATDPFVRTSDLPSGGGTGDVVGPASSTDNNVPQWNGTTGKLLKNGLATTQQSTGSADGGKLVRLTAGGAIYGVSEAGVNGVNGVSVSGDGVRGDSDSGDGGHFASISGNGVHSIASGAASAVLANNQSTGLALEVVQNGGGPNNIARFTDGADGMTIGTDGGLTWDDVTGAATTRAGLGLGTAALNNTGDFDAAGAAAAAQAAAIAASQPLDADLTSYANAADAAARRALIGAGTGSGNGDALTSNPLSQFAATTSAQLAGVVSDETGSGALVFATSPTLVTPALGTPTALVGTNITGTASGLSIGGNAATVTTNANLTGPVTSVGNATAIADAALSIAKTSGLQTALDARLTGTAGTDIAYSGTPTYTAGAAPSGATNHHQFYTQVGNLVTWQIMLTHATTGTTVTGLTATLPAEFPTPLIPSGFTGASAYLYPCSAVRFMSTPTGTITLSTNSTLKRNAANNGFEIVSTIASGSYRTVILSGSYFTA